MKFYELFIALRYIKANLKQSIIIVTAISIGVAIIIWIPSINLSFMEDLINRTVSSAPNITIQKELDTFKTNKTLFAQKFKDENLLLSDQVLTRKRKIKSYKNIIEQLKNIQQIAAMAPFTEGEVFIIRGGEERGVVLRGIVPEELKIVDIEKDIIKGRIKNLSINEIVLGNIFAQKMKVGIGKRIKATGPTGESKSLKVVGIFSTGLRSKDEDLAYVNLKSGQQLLNIKNDVTGIGIKVKDIYKAEETARLIEKITGLYVTSWMEDNKQILDQLNRFKLIILFINFLIIFSAATSITSVFIMLIASKAKEIGILKSMGAENISIMAIFMVQALSLSILGYFLGLLGAKILIIWYSKLIESAGETVFTSQVPVFNLNISYAILAFFYSVFTSIMASILPSYQAAKLRPVEAING
ncbi:MAG: ABC transporter permease [bacterium]